jgi:hypothetical protein
MTAAIATQITRAENLASIARPSTVPRIVCERTEMSSRRRSRSASQSAREQSAACSPSFVVYWNM